MTFEMNIEQIALLKADARYLKNVPSYNTFAAMLPYGHIVKGFYNEKISKIRERYNRFCHYMTETRHDWTVIDTLSFADNSTEVIEKSMLTGETRKRMTIYPHGDVCF